MEQLRFKHKKFWEFSAFQEAYPFTKPTANSTFQWHNTKRLKLIIRVRLGLSHLQSHRFKYSCQDKLNLIWNSGTVETTVLYLLHCPK